MTLRVGIIGAGFMGRVHGEAFRQVQGVEITGFVSRNPEHAAGLASTLGGRIYRTEQELIEDPAVDVVDVTYPTHRHADLTVAAFDAGKHVICEKPIAFTLGDTDRMLAAAEHAGRILCVAHCVRFWPGYSDLQRLVALGEFGRPLAASARRMLHRPTSALWRAGDALTGGVVLDVLVHDYDQLIWLFGPALAVHARGLGTVPEQRDHVVASLRFANGVALAEGSILPPSSFPFRSTLHVICEQGMLDYRFVASGGLPDEPPSDDRLTVYPAQGAAYDLPLEKKSAYLAQAEYFVDCLREGRQPEIGSGSQSREALRVALAARRSMDEGREVPVEG